VPTRGALALVTTVLAVVLLFSFKPADPTTAISGAGATAPVIGAPIASTGQDGPARTPPLIAAGPPAPSARPSRAAAVSNPPTTAPTGTGASGTFTGKAVQTAYGTVQIALVVQDGKIVDVQELQLPSDRRLSQQISAEAGPMLRDQVIRAQSDKINGVSGASYTSYGFYLSLQSALQQM